MEFPVSSVMLDTPAISGGKEDGESELFNGSLGDAGDDGKDPPRWVCWGLAVQGQLLGPGGKVPLG
jgi:hypothetical protein